MDRLHFSSHLDLDRCPHCGVDTPTLAILTKTISTVDHKKSFMRHWHVYGCSRCGGVVIAGARDGTADVVSEYYPSGQKQIDSSIPERARRFLQEARDSTTAAPSGSIVVAAAAVDAMLKDFGYTDGSLKARIDKAAEDHLITASMAQWAHQVRLDANDQRHADTNAPYACQEDAKLTLEFAMALAEYLYVLPSRVNRGIQASASPSASPST